MATISEMLAEARQHGEAGDFARVEHDCRKILDADPENAKALYFLAISFHARGKLAEAVDHYQQALRFDQSHAEVWNDLAVALAMQSRLEEAIRAFEQVVQIRPAFADAHNNLGNTLRLHGRLEQAVAHFREALRLNPQLAGAYINLALALMAQGSADEAIASSRQALLLSPNNSEAWDSLKKAIQLSPRLPEAHNALGIILAKAGQVEEAIASYARALQLNPNFAEAHNDLGLLLCKKDLDEGIARFQEALRLRPDYADAHNNLGNTLRDQGRLDEMIEHYKLARKFKPHEPSFHSALVGSLNYHPRYDVRAIAEEQCRWERDHAQRFMPVAPAYRNDKSPERRLRIGYVSADFSGHVVGRNIWPLMHNHDRNEFDITLYANMAFGEPMTKQFQQCADCWRPIATWPDDRVAERIRQDSIDILVDLSLHTNGNRLLVFARKPAPLQVTFAGYPGSTGLRAIDYRLTDPYLDPPGIDDQWYAEESYRLPHSFWCYDPQTDEPAVGLLPALEKGFITFSGLNNFCKVNDEVLILWSSVLRTVPRSRLLLLAKQGSHRQRTLAFFDHQGIAAERVEFFSPRARPDYLALYNRADIGLDAFPYNGHTTSLDSLWMGVPVITLIGKTVVGRAGLSQLTNLGLEELAASTPEQFVRISAELARDLGRLTTLRSGLRQRMRESHLMDAKGFTRGIEQAYRDMWRKWCGRHAHCATG